MKKTIEQKLHSRRLTPPNKIIYNLLGYLWKFTISKKYNLKYEFIDNIKDEPGSFILISNHASRLDYIFTAIPLLPKTLNYVAGYNEFFRSHLHGVFKLLNVIPKKNFTPDIYTITEIKRVINKKGRVCIFPEGMSSISGHSQPVALGSAKLFKFLKVPVYLAHIDGGYLTSPKYNLNDRLGEVKVTYKKLFDVDSLNKLSNEEITSILNKEVVMDDYAFNKHNHIYYKSNEICKNIHQLLYKCPNCKEEFKMNSDNNSLFCPTCGFKITMDNYYDLYDINHNKLDYTPSDLFDKQRKDVINEIKNNNFYLEDEVEIGFLPKYKFLKKLKTSNIEGKGLLRIDHSGISFTGKRNNEEFNFKINLKDVPTYGMCTDCSRFYTFVGGEFIEFYPKRNSVIKWFLVTEELHRLHGGLWLDYNK